MTTSADSPTEFSSRPLRLDPCALPTGTAGGFQMLVGMALLAVWGLAGLFVDVPSWLGAGRNVSPETVEILKDLLRRGADGLNLEKLMQLERAHPEMTGYFRRRVFLVVLSIGLVMLQVVAATGRFFAGWNELRRRTLPIFPEAAPRMVHELGRILRRLQIPRFPELRARSGWLDGEAHGNRYRSLLILAGPWLERSWNDLQKATVLHEVAHLENGDSLARESARCLWVVAAVFTACALVLWPFLGNPDPGWPWILLRTGLPFAAASLMWAELVRDREFYADARVVSWGYGEALARRLSLPAAWEKPEESLRHPGRNWARWVIRFLGKHPSNGARRQILRNSAPLFDISLKQAAAAGLVAGLLPGLLMALTEICNLAAGLVTALLVFSIRGVLALLIALPLVYLVLFVVLAHFVSAGLGNQTIRLAVADLAAGKPPATARRHLVAVAAFFAVAFQLGLLTSFGPPRGETWLRELGWVAGVAFSMWLWLLQAYSAGRGVVGEVVGTSLPPWLLPSVRWLLALSLVFLAVPAIVSKWLIVIYDRQELLASFSFGGGDSMAIYSALVKYLLILFAFPALGAWFLATLFSLAVLHLWRLFRRPRCPYCSEPIVGRRGLAALRCRKCEKPVAAWLMQDNLEVAR